MPRYRVTMYGKYTAVTQVEAESEDAALEKAQEMGLERWKVEIDEVEEYEVEEAG